MYADFQDLPRWWHELIKKDDKADIWYGRYVWWTEEVIPMGAEWPDAPSILPFQVDHHPWWALPSSKTPENHVFHCTVYLRHKKELFIAGPTFLYMRNQIDTFEYLETLEEVIHLFPPLADLSHHVFGLVKKDWRNIFSSTLQPVLKELIEAERLTAKDLQ